MSKLDASIVPTISTGGWSGPRAALPLAVDPTTGKVYVGFTAKTSASYSANILAEDGSASRVISVDNAVNAGVAVTSNGFGVLLFDPASDSQRKWVAVTRLSADGTALYATDLFRSANLTDEGTRGEPATSRLVYVAATDQLLAYFEHSQMTQGVRHFGGYLALVDNAGQEAVLNGWFGSHNLDQRAMADGDRAAVLGLGDAYPRGIIFAAFAAVGTSRPRANSIYPMAANGVGATNGQLGGIQDAGDVYLIPFVTNRSLAQDFSAGEWPNTDEAKSQQIEAAAANGTDLGLLRMGKTATAPADGLAATWLDAQRGQQLGEETAISELKSARYCGTYYLLAWKETSTVSGSKKSGYYTLVIDGTGNVKQAKTALPTGYEFMPGDDFVTRPDGRISWSNYAGSQIGIVTLTP